MAVDEALNVGMSEFVRARFSDVTGNQTEMAWADVVPPEETGH